jgi:hypothetical protein
MNMKGSRKAARSSWKLLKPVRIGIGAGDAGGGIGAQADGGVSSATMPK